MSHNHQPARWAVFCRFATTAGVGLVLALSWAEFHWARGQAAAAAAAEPEKSANAPAAPLLSPAESDQRAAAALATGEPERKDAAGPAAAPQKEFNLFEIVREHWKNLWALFAILALSILAMAFALERFLGLRRSRIAPTDLLAGIRNLGGRKGEFDLRQAQRLCKQYPSSAAVVFRAMLAKAGRPVAEVEHALSEACDREASRLYGNVRWQGLTFNLAPMFGLAGTVYGVIIAFFETANIPAGASKTEHLATGIYVALICTLAGLVVAIPAGVLAHYFEGRIMRLMRNVDDVARSILPQLERMEGRVHPRSAAEKGAAEPPTLDLAPPEASDRIV
jgi:biopolymer transport protein ExbB